MPLYAVDIEKSLEGEFWTNRYIVDRASVVDAASSAATLVNMERAFHWDGVLFEKYRVATFPESDGSYIVTPIGLTGNRIATGNRLALFNVARVDIRAATGRPSRKYYRTPIFEEDQIDGALTIAFRGLVDDAINPVLSGAANWVDVDGQELISAATNISVGMRQLRRGSRRRTTPVL